MKKKLLLSFCFLFFILETPLILLSQNNSEIPITTVSTKTQTPDSLTAFDSIPDDHDFIPDTLFLKNGDKITGKILSFEQGRLTIDGQGPGIVSVKWNKISSLSGGSRVFKVQDLNGAIYIGYIVHSTDTGEINIQGNTLIPIRFEYIVRIFPLESEWYRGFKGDLGGGVSYTKSSDVLRINAEYNLYYVISKFRFVNDFSFIETTSENDDPSVRITWNFQSIYSLPHRWRLYEINSFNRNDELGIKSRISFGVGGGNSIVQSERQRLLLLTGIIQNSEKNIESDEVQSNFEWPFTIQHTIYSFNKPNLSTSTSITSYVGITEKNRFRVDASTDVTWEFIPDFKFQVSYYYNFDNKIVEGKESSKDYGIVLSLLLELK